MAMLRLPKRASDGKANLHRGGVGVGIDLSTGTTLAGIQNNRYLEKHPETGHLLRDRQIPQWQTILEMATKLGDKTEFDYLGIDIVLDFIRIDSVCQYRDSSKHNWGNSYSFPEDF